ncbi:hypothetical protein [Kineococcus sp. SYSU DK001]
MPPGPHRPRARPWLPPGIGGARAGIALDPAHADRPTPWNAP